MAGSNAVSKWIDPEPAGREATPLGRTRGARQVAPAPVEINRFHNNEGLSPEAMSQALSELKETVTALEARVAEAEAGSASVVGAAKGLGLSMLTMGDALAKRISTLEETAAEEAAAAEAAAAEKAAQAEQAAAMFVAPPVPARKTLNPRLLLAGGAVIVVAVAAVLFLRPHPPAAPPAQVLYSPAAASPNG